jgi:cysteine-S-conjugate beta-lyase
MDFDRFIDRTNTGSLKWDRYADKELLPFWVADMDFQAAPVILDALRERVDHGVFGYTLARQSCTEAVQEYLAKVHQFVVEPEWILWTPGMVPVLNMVCRAFAKPGDAILTMTPVYYPFLTAPGYADQELQAVPLVLNSAQQVWEIDFDALRKAVSRRTRILILCNPHNPVGKVFTREELEKLAMFIVKHDLILCSDEIHCDLILNDKPHICAGTLSEELLARTIVLMSPSKTYNLAGLACAYAIIPNKTLRQRFQQAIRGIFTEVNCFGYTACEAAYRHGEPWRQAMLTYLEANRSHVYEQVATHMPRIQLYPMDATYLAWLDVRSLSHPRPMQVFESRGIALSDGATFQGEGFVRLNFGCPRSMLDEGLSRMRMAYDAMG